VVDEAVDDVDRALVHALQIDGRAPFRRLAAVLEVSDQTVARRYARLRATHTLRVIAVRDPVAFDQDRWLMRIWTTPDACADLAHALARRGDTSWISICSAGTEIVALVSGPADAEPPLLGLLLRARPVLDVRAERLLHTFDGGPGRPFTTYGPLDRSQIDQLSRRGPVSGRMAPALDATDRRIVEVLSVDGRATLEDLAAGTGASANTVRRRLHDLGACGAVHFDVEVDPRFFHLPVRTLLWLTPDLPDLYAAGAAMAGHPEVTFAAATTGPAGLFAITATRDSRALFRYLTATVAELPGMRAAETASVLRTVKTADTHLGARRTA